MDIVIPIEKYSPDDGVRTNWIDGYRISVQIENNEVVIAANPAGLRTLAAHLLTLAQETMPDGNHIHYDAEGGIEVDSVPLIIVREA